MLTQDIVNKLVDIERLLSTAEIDQLHTDLTRTNELLEQVCHGLDFIMTFFAFIILVVVIHYLYKLFNFLLRG